MISSRIGHCRELIPTLRQASGTETFHPGAPTRILSSLPLFLFSVTLIPNSSFPNSLCFSFYSVLPLYHFLVHLPNKGLHYTGGQFCLLKKTHDWCRLVQITSCFKWTHVGEFDGLTTEQLQWKL